MSQKLLTANAFLNLPEMRGVNNLIEGVLYSHQPLDIHQQVLGSVSLSLRQIVQSGTFRIVRTSVQLDEHTVVQPDLFWVASAVSSCKLGSDGYWHGAPDLVIEILSPGTTRQDRDVKYRLYSEHGVREYWIVDAEESYVEVYRLADDAAGKFERSGVFGLGEQFASPLFADVTLKVDDLLQS